MKSFQLTHRRSHFILGYQSPVAEDSRASSFGVLVRKTTEVGRASRRRRDRIAISGAVDRHAPRTSAFFRQVTGARHVAGGRSVPVVVGGVSCWVPAPTLEKLRVGRRTVLLVVIA